MKIEIKQKEKNIAAMRRIDSEAGNCNKCYYYIRKRVRTNTGNKNRETYDDENIEKNEVVVLKDYCCCYKKSGTEAKTECAGRWIYEHE
jgi:hypothetical protein